MNNAINSVSLDLMRVFALVVAQGSFTKAADILNLPKSSISQKISLLEKQLNSRLLQRTTRNLRLTSQGEIVLNYCQRIVTLANEAQNTLLELQNSPVGKLRVTVPETSGILLFGSALARFNQCYPNITIDLIVSDTPLNLINEGIDLAFRAAPLSDSGLICRRFAFIKRHLVASPAYLLHSGRPKSLADLEHHACLVHHALTHWPLGENWQPKPSVTSNSLLALREIALNQGGIALLPHYVCACDIADHQLEIVLPELKIPDLPFYMIYPSREYLPPILQTFMDFMQQCLIFK